MILRCYGCKKEGATRAWSQYVYCSDCYLDRLAARMRVHDALIRSGFDGELPITKRAVEVSG